jgi:FtsZ-interacting cell division protein ZipA
MLKHLLLFAAINPAEPPQLPEGKTTAVFGMSLRDILLVAGVAVVLALILFLWAYLTRKERSLRRSSSRLSRPIYRAERRKHASANSSSNSRHARRRRRLHPDNLPRNPTLAEAGGLPPIREEPPAV